MERVYNFSQGPSMLPEDVIEKIKLDFPSYNGTGMSVMEICKNSKEYDEIIKEAERLLRDLLKIPHGYKILFMSGGADVQYSAVPMNLLSDHKCADYIISGRLSKNASLEAKKYGDIAIAASSAGATPAFSTVPETERRHFRPDADYVYICFNNSVYGTKFHYIPDTGNIPLVADMSSFLLSEPIDVTKFGLIFADAECGLGVSGLTIVIVRDEFFSGDKAIPSNMNYSSRGKNTKELSTAPIWSIYIAKLVFEWLLSLGGLEEVKRRNERKASLIYDYLDSQTYYTAPVDKKCRSMMNVVFVTGDSALDKKFAKEAEEFGIYNILGDSSLGGICASIYSAMSPEGVEALVRFMKKFAQENPKIDA